MKKPFLLITLAIGALLCGCVAVPKTTLSYGKLKFSSPKDETIGSLKIMVNPTNGLLAITASKIGAVNNPEVISSSANGQADIIKATSDAINSGFAAGAKAAGKSVIP